MIIENPSSEDTAESDAQRNRTSIRFRESVPLRINDPIKSATDLCSFPELPPEQAQHLEKVFMQYLDDTAARAMALHINPPKGRGAWTAELVTGWSRR